MAWWVEAHWAHCGTVTRRTTAASCTRRRTPTPARCWAGCSGWRTTPSSWSRPTCAAGCARQLESLADAARRPGPRAPGAREAHGAEAARRTSGAGRATTRCSVEVDRFTRLTALATYLLRRCDEDEATLEVAEVRAALGVTAKDLRADVRLLNVVNFGGDGCSSRRSSRGRKRLHVSCEAAGPALARPARLSPLQADTLLLAIELVGRQLPTSSGRRPRRARPRSCARARGGTPALGAGDLLLARRRRADRGQPGDRRAPPPRHPVLDGGHRQGHRPRRGAVPPRAQPRRVVLRLLVPHGRGHARVPRRHHEERRARGRDLRAARRRRARPVPARGHPRRPAATRPRRRPSGTAPPWRRWIAERQPVEQLPDGACVASQPYVDDRWLAAHLLRFADQARPLEPPEAVDGLRAAVRRLLDVYALRPRAPWTPSPTAPTSPRGRSSPTGRSCVICMLAAPGRPAGGPHGDLLDWLVAGFLWSLLPFAGVIVMWWIVAPAPRARGAPARRRRRRERAGLGRVRRAAAARAARRRASSRRRTCGASTDLDARRRARRWPRPWGRRACVSWRAAPARWSSPSPTPRGPARASPSSRPLLDELGGGRRAATTPSPSRSAAACTRRPRRGGARAPGRPAGRRAASRSFDAQGIETRDGGPRRDLAGRAGADRAARGGGRPRRHRRRGRAAPLRRLLRRRQGRGHRLRRARDDRLDAPPGVHLASRASRVGRLRENPFQATLREIAARTPLALGRQPRDGRRAARAAVRAGDPAAAQEALARDAAPAWLRTVAEPLRRRRRRRARAQERRPLPGEPGGDLPRPRRPPGARRRRPRSCSAPTCRSAPATGPASATSSTCSPPPRRRPSCSSAGCASRSAPAASARSSSRACSSATASPSSARRTPAFLEPLAHLGVAAFDSVDAALAAEDARLGRRARVLAVADAMATVVTAA